MSAALVITTPAASLQLLSAEEMRVAAGLEHDDDTQDETLEARGLTVAADIASECNVAIGQGGEPTLLKETLTETFEDVRSRYLRLSRRHNVVISSITIDDDLVDAASYRVDPETGIVSRKASSDERGWIGVEVVVVYTAGFETVPAGLKQEATDRFSVLTTNEERDPYVKGETVEVPGIETKRIDYWAGELPGSGSSSSSDAVVQNLRRFYNAVVA